MNINLEEILLCPIAYQLFTDPVITAQGHTYEGSSIKEWFISKNTDPVTNLHCPKKQLIPNLFVKNLASKQEQLSFNLQDFTCPLTRKVMIDPVITSAGYTYEREILEEYFKKNGFIDPVTKTSLDLIENNQFIPNVCAKQCIDHCQAELQTLTRFYESWDDETNFQNFASAPMTPTDLTVCFLSQSLETQKKFLYWAVKNFHSHVMFLCAELHYDHVDQMFFDLSDCIRNLAKDRFKSTEYCALISCNSFYGYESLGTNLKILKEKLDEIEKIHGELLDIVDESELKAFELSEKDILLEVPNENGETLLHRAVAKNNVELIKWLIIDKNVNFDCKNHDGNTPLEQAVNNNQCALVEILIRIGVPLSKEKLEKFEDNAAKTLAKALTTPLDQNASPHEYLLKIIALCQKYFPRILNFLDKIPLFSAAIMQFVKIDAEKNRQTFLDNRTKKINGDEHNSVVNLALPVYSQVFSSATLPQSPPFDQLSPSLIPESSFK